MPFLFLVEPINFLHGSYVNDRPASWLLITWYMFSSEGHDVDGNIQGRCSLST